MKRIGILASLLLSSLLFSNANKYTVVYCDPEAAPIDGIFHDSQSGYHDDTTFNTVANTQHRQDAAKHGNVVIQITQRNSDGTITGTVTAPAPTNIQVRLWDSTLNQGKGGMTSYRGVKAGDTITVLPGTGALWDKTMNEIKAGTSRVTTCKKVGA